MCQKVCRVLKDGHTLSCAQNKTHSKPHAHGKIASLPCASPRNTRQKSNTRHITIFAVCRPQNTRQTSCTCHSRAEVDGGASEVDGAQLCRVPHGAQGKHATLPCATAWHTANKTLRCVLFFSHGKQFENFEFSNLKLFLHCRDIAWYSVLKFGIFVVMFTIYKNCVSVKRIFRMSQILNCKYIK